MLFDLSANTAEGMGYFNILTITPQINIGR